jgi:phosphatidylserine synthase
MMIQEIHFLHERSAKIAWFVGVQIAGTSAIFIATVYIVPAMGFGWWYGILTIISGAVLILAFFFVVETKFDRPSDAERKSYILLLFSGNLESY